MMLAKHPLMIAAILLVVYYLVFVSTISVNNVVGKSIIISTVLGVSYCYGKVAGLISAVVGMLLLHKNIEGLDTNGESSTEETSSKEEDSSEENEESSKGKPVTITEEAELDETITVDETPKESSEEEDSAASQEKEAAAKSTNNVIENEEKMRPTSSNDEAEGFSNYGTNSHVEPFSLVSQFTNQLSSF